MDPDGSYVFDPEKSSRGRTQVGIISFRPAAVAVAFPGELVDIWRMKFWQKAVLCIVATETLGNISGLVTFVSIDDWYSQLTRPAGTPPNGAFGPVWLTLYGMMGYAFALVWDRGTDRTARNSALRWFGIQFALNMAWTPAFFGMHQMGIAFVVILLLWAAIMITIFRFSKAHRPATYLLIPYLLWVSYATYLNAGFWMLNR